MDLDNLTDRIANLSPAKRALLEMKLKQKSTAPTISQAIPRRSDVGPVPLSFAQERLWFLDQLEPESRAYNQPRLIRLKGHLDTAALRAALCAIVARHEVLRTTYHAGEEHPIQLVGDSSLFEVSTIDISSEKTSEEQKARVQEIALEWSDRHFDLSRDFMLRGVLIRLGPVEHVLLLVSHHIASDGWSGGILWRELVALYTAFSKGEPDPLPPLDIQYADYALWQRQWLQGGVLENQLSYWSRQLSNIPVLELLTDKPRPPIQSYRGARQSHSFSGSLSGRLQALSRKEGATLYMILLAAFQTLLHRYTGQNDIVVGSPIAGRARPELEGLIGFFVNMLVLRSDLSDNPKFKDLLSRIRKTAFEAYENQDVPFEKLVAVLHPERDLSRSPLFQVMFAFQNIPRQSRDLPGLTVSPVELENETAKYDLSLYMWEEAGGLAARLEYNTDLFEAAWVERMLGHFETLLDGIVECPEHRIADLPLLTDREQKQLLIEWNNTHRELPQAQCVHQLFEAQVARSPDEIAVVFGSSGLTYRELNARANQLAHYLRGFGVGPEMPVGVCLGRSWQMLVAILGVLKAGGAYVPLDPSYPAARLSYVLKDAGIGVLITETGIASHLSEVDARVVYFDTESAVIAGNSDANPSVILGPDNLAYIIYTSGSTGQPKGVQIPHSAMVNFLNAMREQPGLANGDVLLAVTTLSFDIAGLELYLPLSVGARVVIAAAEDVADGARLLDLIKAHSVNVLQATPATWRLLIESGWSAGSRLKILCGGEAMPSDLAHDLLQRASSLWNMYGPTETTVWSAVASVASNESPVSIGRPIDNTKIYILDTNFNPMPVGVAGELCIGGLGLARGYKNRPDLTAQQFTPDPFSESPGARIYRTGDLARYLADGSIECLGRIDHQVKLRGFRIELGEIETVLGQHREIKQVVVADKELAGDKRLVGYIVAQADCSPEIGSLQEFVREKLPEYMIPSEFIFLDRLPLTPNGKVDRRSLPTPDGMSRETRSGAILTPRNLVELELAEIWRKVLNVASLDVRDSFFDLGGHSLLAVRLFAQIEKKFEKKLPLATLFEAPTVELMAKLLRREDWVASWSSLVPIQPNGSKPPFFCVHAHGGNVLNFNDLARHLGLDQPFFGLQARGLDGSQPKHRSIEEMARDYLKETREVQPKGPYLLGGYCFGGKVAFEMARQLQSEGEKVALLALIDAVAPGYRTSLPWLPRRVAQIQFHWDELKKARGKGRLDYLLEKSGVVRDRVLRMARAAADGRNNHKQENGSSKIRSYQPSPYPGKITVFAPTTTHSAYYRFEPHLGWIGFAGGELEVREVPGRVTGLMAEPYVKGLAEQLEACIVKATGPITN